MDTVTEIKVMTRGDLKQAMALAKKAHAGQKYGKDKDYFETHIKGVVKRLHDNVTSETVLVLGALHDIYEDTKITREEIVKMFGNDIDEYIWVLTRKPDEKYFDYIRRVKMNWIARTVKIEDVAFNLKESEISGDESKQHRYAKALLILLGYD